MFVPSNNALFEGIGGDFGIKFYNLSACINLLYAIHYPLTHSVTITENFMHFYIKKKKKYHWMNY